MDKARSSPPGGRGPGFVRHFRPCWLVKRVSGARSWRSRSTSWPLEWRFGDSGGPAGPAEASAGRSRSELGPRRPPKNLSSVPISHDSARRIFDAPKCQIGHRFPLRGPTSHNPRSACCRHSPVCLPPRLGGIRNLGRSCSQRALQSVC